jgi:hypothetical protein
MANNPNASANLKPFKPKDPRINRRGRPKSFDAFRALAQQIAHEATDRVESGHKVTIAEKILRDWALSRNPQLQRAFIEVAFGKVPDQLELSGKEGKEVTFRIIYDESRIPNSSAQPTPKATDDIGLQGKAQDNQGG